MPYSSVTEFMQTICRVTLSAGKC